MTCTKAEAIALIQAWGEKIWPELAVEPVSFYPARTLPVRKDSSSCPIIKRTGIEVTSQSNKASKQHCEETIK